ncbi:MAG: hypothetical protein FWB86_11780 [Treponema sp.]|nr:hypothetical protein [Treponema sp.]MCL2273113.1 hypothetical protein [Treponema sp.]
MTKRERSAIYYIIGFPALIAMMFQLSSFAVIPAIECRDDCTCLCNIGEPEETDYSSNCCASQIVKVSNKCCNNEQSHDAHFTLSGYKGWRNIPCDLRTHIFNSRIFLELCGIVCEEQYVPVEIVYYIFKPPII